jgi:ketosteroid isomerase-like protein
MSNSERLIEVMVPALGGLEPRIDAAAVDRMAAAIESIATDDFTCGMVAFDVTQEFTGTEGVKAAWRDWLEAYSELRFRIGEFREVGENVLMLVDQVGITRHDAVEVEQPSAAVWMFRDGRLRRVEFHLDRSAAERAAQSGQE